VSEEASSRRSRFQPLSSATCGFAIPRRMGAAAQIAAIADGRSRKLSALYRTRRVQEIQASQR